MSISITPEHITKPRDHANIRSEFAALPNHIDINETIALFRVDPRLLKPSSERMVVTNCSSCGTIRHRKFRYAIAQRLCLSCSNRTNSRSKESREKRSTRMKRFYKAGGKHPTKGIGHSQAACDKISKAHLGVKESMTEERRAKLVANCIRILLDPVQSERTRAVNRLRKGPLSYSYGRTPAHTIKVWHTKPDGTQVCFRSTWEDKFATHLTTHGVEWSYEPKTFPVEYVLDSCVIQGTYTPDFYTDAGWYEVKGRWTMEGRAKFDAFVATYSDKITIIDRQWLKEKGLL